MTRTIVMTVPLSGISKGERKTSFETSGFAGEGCRTATEAFEKALGTPVEETVKSEMYDVEERHEFLNNG